MEYYIVYLLLATIPVWYLVYSLKRIKRHYHDGVDRGVHKTRYFYIKVLFALTMVVVTLSHLVEVGLLYVDGNYSMEKALTVLIYLGLWEVS